MDEYGNLVENHMFCSKLWWLILNFAENNQLMGRCNRNQLVLLSLHIFKNYTFIILVLLHAQSPQKQPFASSYWHGTKELMLNPLVYLLEWCWVPGFPCWKWSITLMTSCFTALLPRQRCPWSWRPNQRGWSQSGCWTGVFGESSLLFERF